MKEVGARLAEAADEESRLKLQWEKSLERLEVAKEKFAIARKQTPGETLPRGLLEKAYFARGWLIKVDSVGKVCHMERTLEL